MSLIKWSECQKVISSKAASCPQCGAPVSTESVATKTNLVTTRNTAKTLKMHSLIAGLILMVGVVMIVVNVQGGEPPTLGGLLTIVGLIWFIVTRVCVSGGITAKNQTFLTVISALN